MPSRRKSPPDWPVSAQCVAESLPWARTHSAVQAWAPGRRKAEAWAVAFSGGADSLALLLVLWVHAQASGRKLVVLHFNHRLRGAESTADERFCRAVCRGLGVPLKIGRWMDRARTANENQARAARHAFFAQAMKGAKIRVLWLAHQQDDVAESLLMRLARGSGVGGLAAPRPVQAASEGRIHLRPFLTFSKRELESALRRAGVTWREDTSNAGDAHFRNRIRAKVVPAWVAAAGRDAVAGAARSRDLLEEDEQAMEGEVDRRVGRKPGRVLPLAALAGAPRAFVRRALHRWLLVVRPPTDLSRQGFDLLLAAVERGRPTRFSLGAKTFAEIRDGRLGLKRG